MAQYTYNSFISSNVAPQNAEFIGVYDSNNNRVGEIPLGYLKRIYDEPLYRFGILSDIHVDTTDYNYQQYINAYPYSDEGMGDLRRALKWLRDVEHVNMICACGDLSQYGEDSEFQLSKTEIDNEIPNIPFYTCTGNHDCYNSHAGASTFKNFFNSRTIDTTSNAIITSTAYTNSFYFLKTFENSKGETSTDVFIFFSMYNYSASNAYLSQDIAWLESILETYKTNRIFVFTHLFFPEYAGNLGRVNGTGGIYPTGNWLSGDGLTALMELLRKYQNVFWFSGHSHWKWDLQRFQDNVTVARYGNFGSWTVHVPSLALPIDSDYTDITQQTDNNRVEKPLESQGGVVDVYEDKIVIRGIDFNINTSQNGDTTQGFSGDTYVKYLPISMYELHTGYNSDDGEEIEIGMWELGGFSSNSSAETEYNGTTQVIRSYYIPVSASNAYLLTTEAPIGDRTNPDSIRELSIWCFSGTTEEMYILGRIENQEGLNTPSSKIGSSATTLRYFDRVYDHEDLSNAIFGLYPSTTHIRMRLYRMGTVEDPEGSGTPITIAYGDRVHLEEIINGREYIDPDTGETRPTSEYVIYSNLEINSSKQGAVAYDPWNDYGDDYADYVAATFNGTGQGFWVTSPSYSSTAGTAQTATVVVEDLKVFSGSYGDIDIETAQTISLPQYLGFYDGTNHSGAERYQIASGFQPSTHESSSNGRVQFQTSSSYAGGTVTVLMKVKVNFT